MLCNTTARSTRSTSSFRSHLGDGPRRTSARILQAVLSRIAPVPNDNRPPQAPRVEWQLSRNVPSFRLCEVSVGFHLLITPRNSSDFAWCCAISIVLWKQDCASTVLSCILKNSPCRRIKFRLVIPIPVLLRQARPFSTVLDGFQSLLGAAMRLRPRSLRCRYRYSGYVAARLVECSRLLD
jgi:hypothetical protein